MKKVFIISLIFIILGSMGFKCGDEHRDETLFLTKEKMIGKWIVNNDSELGSFEFTDDGYYIAQMVEQHNGVDIQNVIIDNYDFDTYYYPVLNNLGEVHNHHISRLYFRFTLNEENGENKIYFNTVKKEPYKYSTQLKRLCKNWITEYINDEYVFDNDIRILFTVSGTLYSNKITPYFNVNLMQWKWKDNEHKVICFSSNGTGPVCENVNEVVIDELTYDKLSFTLNGDHYVLSPVNIIQH